MDDLFYSVTIPRHSAWRLEGEALPTAAAPRWAQTLDGQTWMFKDIKDSGPEEVEGEALGWHFGRLLGASIPDAAIGWRDGLVGWFSRREPGVRHWIDEARDRIANLDEVAAMVVLDAVLANEDRHRANVLLQPGADASYHLWAIDHGALRVADPLTARVLGVSVPTPHSSSPRLPLDALEARVAASAARLEGLASGRVDEIVNAAWASSGRDVPSVVLDTVGQRCRLATIIAGEYVGRLRELP